MGNNKEISGIVRQLENLKAATMRMNQLIEMFVTKDFGTGTADKTASIEKNLETISKRTAKAADHLERTLEILDEDRYLDWLLKVPADCALFQRRKAQTRHRIPAILN